MSLAHNDELLSFGRIKCFPQFFLSSCNSFLRGFFKRLKCQIRLRIVYCKISLLFFSPSVKNIEQNVHRGHESSHEFPQCLEINTFVNMLESKVPSNLNGISRSNWT